MQYIKKYLLLPLFITIEYEKTAIFHTKNYRFSLLPVLCLQFSDPWFVQKVDKSLNLYTENHHGNVIKPLLYDQEVMGSNPGCNVWFMGACFLRFLGIIAWAMKFVLSDVHSGQLAVLLSETEYTWGNSKYNSPSSKLESPVWINTSVVSTQALITPFPLSLCPYSMLQMFIPITE